MRFILSILFVLINSTCFSNPTWEQYWTQAIVACTSNDFELGVIEFTCALELLKQNEDKTHDYVYIDRGRTYLLLEKPAEALNDFNYALSRNQLSQKDLTRALVSKIVALARLDRSEECLPVLDELKKVDQEFPKTTISKDFVIIRNMPDCDCYRSRIKCYLIHSGLCEKASDIQILPSGVCIAKKKCNCGCKECEERDTKEISCEFCGQKLNFTQQAQNRTIVEDQIADCKRWCDKVAIAGATWCGRFKTYRCQAGCALAVDFLREGCHWCCNGGEFYKRCVQPFEDIGKYIQPPCDPMWD